MFHVTSVALHALTAGAAAFAFATFAPEGAALAGAALFAVVAAPAEAVLSLSGRADVLFALFFFLGLIAHRRGRILPAAAALLLGALCKETALIAPVAFLLFGPRRIRDAAVYAGTLAIAAALRIAALGGLRQPVADPLHNPLHFVPPLERIFGAARVFARFTAPGIVDPFRRLYLCSAPACGGTGPGDPLAWLGLVLLLAMLALPVLLWRRQPVVARGLALFDLFFFPISNLIVAGPSAYGERLLYLPVAGLCVAAGTLVIRAWPLLLAVGALNAVALQFRDVEFRRTTSLYLSALKVAPDSAAVQLNAAVAEYRLHDAAAAERYARKALELSPGFPQAEALLALSLDRLGRGDESERWFADAFARSGSDVDIAQDYARFLLFHRRRDEARAVLLRARSAHPDSSALDALLRLAK